MNNALQSSITTNPGLKGILYADANGFCISGWFIYFSLFPINLNYSIAAGELDAKNAGRYCSISRLAGSLDSNSPPPVVLIETRDRHILVKEYDGNTIVLKCAPNSD